MDDFVIDEKPEDEDDVPTQQSQSESDPQGQQISSEQAVIQLQSEQPEVPMEREQPAIPMESEQLAIPMENEQLAIPMESEQPAIPMESEQPIIPVVAEIPVVPLASEPTPETDGLVTETQAMALDNPPTPVENSSPLVTTSVPEQELPVVPEKVVKKKAVAAVLERNAPEDSGGNRIPNSGDLVHENESRLEAELQQLLKDIRRVGVEGKPEVTFGELFDDDQVANYYEALVGTLKSAKKRNLIDFKGQMLLKGAHDTVMISIVGE